MMQNAGIMDRTKYLGGSDVAGILRDELLSNLVYEAIRQRRDLMLHPPVRRL